jgi:hypothetical protein
MQLHEAEFLSYSAIQENFPHLMEPEGSLLSSREPDSGPYPVPDDSSPQPPPDSLQIHLILSSHLRLIFLSGLFLSGFRTNISPLVCRTRVAQKPLW